MATPTYSVADVEAEPTLDEEAQAESPGTITIPAESLGGQTLKAGDTLTVVTVNEDGGADVEIDSEPQSLGDDLRNTLNTRKD